MHAMAPFALSGEPITDLTRLDCSDLENVKDARHRLRRCRTEADFATWAAEWGEKLCNRAEETFGLEEVNHDDLEEAEAEAARAEKERDELEAVAKRVISEFDAMAVDLPDEVVNRLNDIFAKLENAL